MLVSVIIPMYNAEQSIERCLKSVLNQTYKEPMEIIIINDGSEDNSAEKVKNFLRENVRLTCKVRLIEQVNGGVSKARNAGFAICSGDLIALLDADDEWLPSKLEKQIQVLNGHPNIDFLGCSRNNETLRLFGRKIRELHKASVKELLTKMFPQTSTAIFKRTLLDQVGQYDESLTHGEDSDLWIRFCAVSNFYYLPESLVITGNGKPSFGHSGLSANLAAMQKGYELNIKMAKNKHLISMPLYALFYVFGKLKYFRRILVTKIR